MFRPMSPIPPPVQAVLDLFDRELAEVRFGDVDAKRLSALASEVQSAAVALEAHEATTAKLRAALAERQETLLQQAQRALAFARIYAEEDAALSAKVAEITLPRPPKRAKGEAAARAAEPTPPEPAKEDVKEEAVAEEAPAPARRGKRRESSRTVARDDEAFDAPAAEA
jgi:hypothetical protein